MKVTTNAADNRVSPKEGIATQASGSHGPTDRWTAWDGFLEETPHTGFMQASWWADFRATVGFEHFGAVVNQRGTTLGGAMVQKFPFDHETCFYYVQDGPVLPSDPSIAEEVFGTILEAIEDRRKSERETVSHLRIEPRWQDLPNFVRGFETPAFEDAYMEPRNTLCIDLRLSEEAILTQMKPKGRYNIRVAQKHGVSIIEDNSLRGISDFLKIYGGTANRQGFEGKPAYYFRPLASFLFPFRHGSIYFAEYEGKRIAVALVVFFGPRATYFFGGSTTKHRHVMAPYLLHFEIMRHAKALGHEWYDLWGIAPANEPDHSWHDISVFKHKFGGVEVNLIRTLDYVYDRNAYNQYILSYGEKSEETPEYAL